MCNYIDIIFTIARGRHDILAQSHHWYLYYSWLWRTGRRQKKCIYICISWFSLPYTLPNTKLLQLPWLKTKYSHNLRLKNVVYFVVNCWRRQWRCVAVLVVPVWLWVGGTDTLNKPSSSSSAGLGDQPTPTPTPTPYKTPE